MVRKDSPILHHVAFVVDGSTDQLDVALVEVRDDLHGGLEVSDDALGSV